MRKTAWVWVTSLTELRECVCSCEIRHTATPGRLWVEVLCDAPSTLTSTAPGSMRRISLALQVYRKGLPREQGNESPRLMRQPTCSQSWHQASDGMDHSASPGERQAMDSYVGSCWKMCHILRDVWSDPGNGASNTHEVPNRTLAVSSAL